MTFIDHISSDLLGPWSLQSVAVAIAALGLLMYLWIFIDFQKYPDVPTLRLSSKPWIWGAREDAKLWVTDALSVLLTGYERYSSKGQNYLVTRPEGKLMVVAPRFIEEVRRAPETHVQNLPANNELTQLRYTLHPKMTYNQFHHDIPLRKSLTESLGPKLPDIVEEAKLTLNARSNSLVLTEWVSYKMYPLGFQIVTRTANRLLFGIELTRNAEFEQLSINYAGILFGGAEKIRSYPSFLKPLIMWYATDIHRTQREASKHLAPVIEKRIQEEDKYVAAGSHDEWKKRKPEDVIQWVLDVAPPEDRRVDHLVYRMLHINVGAIHTSSISFLETIYFLAIYPQYHQDLRDEIESVFKQEKAWTKQALTNLKRLDSFITEALRLCPFTALKLQRCTVQDWKMSDGTVIPKGVHFWCNYFAMSQDDAFWENAKTFDPWRMYRLRQQPGQENQHQWVMTTSTNLTFGHGKHACPGRFFAANEIKTLLALIIMNYDIRCRNLQGGLEAIVRGDWTNQSKDPIKYPVMDFRYREDDIPKDIRYLFTEI
ncbi:uncharacterized protein Z518_03501 [Rhinocladiella mackenziei CBS 650.93]|uniref:Rhinocladiella mackenziei CBS 650.93 unplaced genomic scaffold supercont1.2, whole genome shotgun sequence n=1 Tax=Rhinocladiella mackenziei CBS 650.93 TaxID=1442369 RepID=A0A0D2IS63_9EURO|nr:uncharacterized protein Z518_03501 [Rhinocladiella mackenziei CBS 650.93]KIX08844.1 hypothetical protein Z518_03501 [Rhinocladiella mackenziei CBS 650.93]